MQVTGPWRKEFRLALQSSYPNEPALAMMVQESLEISLPEITASDTLPNMVFRLIEWAIARGRLTELVQKSAADNPLNEKLQQAASHFEFSKADKGTGEVERILARHVAFENVGQWVRKLSETKQRICRVEPQSGSLVGYGTGFLLGPDLLITNSHVLAAFSKPREVRLRFDYEADSLGLAVQPGKTYELADDWLLAESSTDKLDYALLRLSQKAGDEVINGQSRGFLKPEVVEVHKGDPLLILQHPSAQPLKISIGSIQSESLADPYLSYSANTVGGSSGSPCMTMALSTIAIHHMGSASANRGVLWRAILADLSQAGKLGLLPA